MAADFPTRTTDAARLRRANRRTAFIVAAIAGLFFVGVIAAQFMGAMGMTVVGGAAFLLLAFAIGRNLRNRGGPDA
jgi:hypothetical protein